ncbi:MAG: site-2 protease family protein [Kiritimatiellae bacterium]|nr:site-2 protease family protein [Kiritimatiellia bacterium]
MSERIVFALVSFTALVPAIILHEVAHGYVAYLCGDSTARDEGRLSLNPLRHVDPFMSVILPAFLALSGSRVLFGGAKPVPINLGRCRNPLRAYWMTAAAGPLCNLLQTAAGALFFAATGWLVSAALSSDEPWSWVVRQSGFEWRGFEPVRVFRVRPWLEWTQVWLYCYCATNAALMVFNLIPIPPLDGSRIVTVLLRGNARRTYASLERYGLLLVFAVLYFPQTGRVLSRLVDAMLSLLGVKGV